MIVGSSGLAHFIRRTVISGKTPAEALSENSALTGPLVTCLTHVTAPSESSPLSDSSQERESLLYPRLQHLSLMLGTQQSWLNEMEGFPNAQSFSKR